VYVRSAAFYDLLYEGPPGSALRDARAEAARVTAEARRAVPGAQTLLDVACGTGRYLAHLADDFAVTGFDLNPDLIDIARQRVPRASFEVADMTDFELGRRFDVITCLFSAIAYAVTAERLQATLERMAAHLEPGGVVIVEPWFGPDTFWDGHVAANYVESDELKVAWMYRQERRDRRSVLPIHYLVAGPERVEHFTEEHELGLFTTGEYTAAMESIGLQVRHDPVAFGRGLYVGTDRRSGGPAPR
jgi:SAM-dependent methyltransferase